MQKGFSQQYQNSYYLHAYDKYRATGQLDIKLNHFNEQQLENMFTALGKVAILASEFGKNTLKFFLMS